MKSPAFQFYPDKWQSHTRRLSDSAYRVYHELICWMWQHSEDQCSIQASPEAVACAVAMPTECVRIAFAEIQNAFSPLLKEEGGKWVSNGLRKEREKQKERRDKAQNSANARWGDANASRKHCSPDANASREQCFPSPSPSPSPFKEQDNAASATPSLIGSKSSVSKANPPALPTESFSNPPVPPTPQFLDFPVDANRVPVDGGASKNQTLQPPPETTFKADFEKLWCEAYVAKFGAKYNYEGGRDGKAVKELEATKNSPATLIEIAKLAWDVPDGKNLYCQHSMTIHGFRRHINNIQAETAKHGGADAMTAPDVLMDKLNAIAKRPSGSRWTTAEVSALKPFRDITDEDLSKLKTYYHAKIADKAQDWRRQTLLAMLQNLPGELDKARRFKPATCF